MHILLLHFGLTHEIPYHNKSIPVTSDDHVFQSMAEFQPSYLVFVPSQYVTCFSFIIAYSDRFVITHTDDDIVLMGGEFGIECTVVVCIDVSEVLVVGWVE